MSIDEWVKQNYTSIVKLSEYYTDDKSIITHFYIWLNKPNRFNKILSMPHDEQMKFLNKWMGNNSRWKNSEFNKERAVNQFDDIWDDDYSEELLEHNNISMEILAETANDDIKMWLIDIEEEWGCHAPKLVKIREVYLKMDLLDRVLYDLYFTNMMSERKIADKLGIPHSSVHVMMVDLIKKLRDACGTYSIA